MAWTTPRTYTTGELITAALMNVHVRDNFDYLKGSGGTVTIEAATEFPGYVRITQAAGTQKLLMGNQDSSGSANPSIIAAGNGALQFGGGDSWAADGGTFGVLMTLTDGGILAIGDTSNANMTRGLTINQGATTNESLASKSSNVAHGITDYAETDTTFHLKTTTYGGAVIEGFAEAGLDQDTIYIRALQTDAPSATRSTAVRAPISLIAGIKSGTGGATVGADKNLVSIGDFGATRFFFDSDGDSHQDVGTAWTNYDDHDDAALLTSLSVHVSRPDDPIRTELGDFLQTNRARLEALRLVTFNDDGHHFVNMSRLTMLLVGAVRQVSGRLDAVMGRLENVERKLLTA